MKKLACRLPALLLAAFLLSVTNAMSQENKKELTLEDLIPGGETYRRAENRWYQWYGDAACLELGIDSIKGIRTAGAKAGTAFTAITLEEVNRLLAGQGLGKLSHLYNVKTINQADASRAASPLLLLTTGKHRVLIDWQEKKVLFAQPRPEGAANEDRNPVSSRVAYTLGNNLYVQEADGNTRRVTYEPEGVVCGQSVHRNEFGISKGTFWNADGTRLAFYRMDERMVTEYPLVDVTARVGKLNPVRYPMAGMASHKVQVGIYNPISGQTLYLNTGDPTDRYFTNICWAPDSKSLYLIELNRDQNHAKLCRYDAESGDLQQVLLEETHPKYVEPMTPIVFLPWDDGKFIYQSQRDGYNHLYLYNTEGELLKQLTSGDWLVQELVGFDIAKREIIFTATKESPLQSNIYKVSVNKGKITRLDGGEGVHSVMLSPSGTYLVDSYTAPSLPRAIDLVNTRTAKSTRLLTASDPYEGCRMPLIETGTLKAADGETDLYYRLVKPADFDPAKKYPAIVYVYGGPHAQMVTNGWQHGVRGWDLYMANRGYIMFSLDNRGSANRGLEFENATFRQLGIEEGKDQVKGAEFLKSLPYVDGNRIGVHGWSFGGHMTTALMLRYPDIFKVGVAGGPVIDWAYYEVMYGERYMDTPQSNPEGYEATNLKNLAGNLKGRLLLIHDDQDNTCVPQHTLSFLKACVDARTYPDLFIYPTHLHNVSGRDRVHLHEKITRYFEEHL